MSEKETLELRLQYWRQEKERLSNHAAVKAYLSAILLCKELEGIIEVVQKEGEDGRMAG